jgi:hypothetical protein
VLKNRHIAVSGERRPIGAQTKSPLAGGPISSSTQKLQGTEMVLGLDNQRLNVFEQISGASQSMMYRSTRAFNRLATVAAIAGESIAAPLSMYVHVPSGSMNAATIPAISPVRACSSIFSSASTRRESPSFLAYSLTTLLSLGYIVFKNHNAIAVPARRHRGLGNPTKRPLCLFRSHVKKVHDGVDLELGHLQQTVENGPCFRLLCVGDVGFVEPAYRLAHRKLKTPRDLVANVTERSFPDALGKVRLRRTRFFGKLRQATANFCLKDSHVHLA